MHVRLINHMQHDVKSLTATGPLRRKEQVQLNSNVVVFLMNQCVSRTSLLLELFGFVHFLIVMWYFSADESNHEHFIVVAARDGAIFDSIRDFLQTVSFFHWYPPVGACVARELNNAFVGPPLNDTEMELILRSSLHRMRHLNSNTAPVAEIWPHFS